MRDWNLPGPGLHMLTAEQVADYIGVGVKKLREMVASGEFPRPLHRHGKSPVWSGLAVACWVYLYGLGWNRGGAAPEKSEESW